MNKPTCDYCTKREAHFDTWLFGLPICLPCLRTFRTIEKDKRKRKLFYMVMMEVVQMPPTFHKEMNEKRAKFLKQRQTPEESKTTFEEISESLRARMAKNDKFEDKERDQKVKTRHVPKNKTVTVVATKSSKKAFTYKKITIGTVYRNSKSERQVISIGNKVGVAKQNPTHAKETIYWIDVTTKAGGECRAKSFSDWFKR